MTNSARDEKKNVASDVADEILSAASRLVAAFRATPTSSSTTRSRRSMTAPRTSGRGMTGRARDGAFFRVSPSVVPSGCSTTITRSSLTRCAPPWVHPTARSRCTNERRSRSRATRAAGSRYTSTSPRFRPPDAATPLPGVIDSRESVRTFAPLIVIGLAHARAAQPPAALCPRTDRCSSNVRARRHPSHIAGG